MLNRFQNGTIVEFQAGEDIKNNDLYIVDLYTRGFVSRKIVTNG